MQGQLLFYRLFLLPLQSKDRLSMADSDALELLKNFAEDVKFVRHLIGIGNGRPRRPVVIRSHVPSLALDLHLGFHGKHRENLAKLRGPERVRHQCDLARLPDADDRVADTVDRLLVDRHIGAYV